MDINLIIRLDENFSKKVDKLLDLLSIITEKKTNKSSENEPDTAVTKVAIVEDDAIEVNNLTEAKPETVAKSEPVKKKASKDDVIKALQALAKKSGKAAAGELLNKYGATKVSELDEDNYDSLVEDAERMI